MWEWIKSLFGGKEEKDGDGFARRERLVYRYFDGEKEVTADPMELWKALMDVWPEFIVDVKLANSGSKDAWEGRTQAVEKARKLFNVKPILEGGLTSEEVLAEVDRLIKFCHDVKKNAPRSAT